MSDQELILRYRESGDSSLVGELFERYALQIYGICRKYLKEDEESKDASMEVFEYLLVELKKYEVQNFKPWLGRATRNFCLMRIRKNSSLDQKADTFRKNEQERMESEWDPHLPNEDISEKEQSLQSLEAAIQLLNSEQKVCVELFFLKQKSYQEVASITGYSYKQVKSYIQNGKRNLRKHLSHSNG